MSIHDAPWIKYADTNGVPPRSRGYMNGYEDEEESYYDDETEDNEDDLEEDCE